MACKFCNNQFETLEAYMDEKYGLTPEFCPICGERPAPKPEDVVSVTYLFPEDVKRSCLNCVHCGGDGTNTPYICLIGEPEFDTFSGYCGYHQYEEE